MTTTTTSLLGLRGISREEMLGLLDHAGSHLPMVLGEAPWPQPAGDSRLIANVFLEDSTRTRCSFEIAAKRLGHHTVNLTSSGTSV
ncbi:MAG: aspartate carbamoyltransferase, partial [Phycisphaerales bacterium]|nr:aspartate carbamoyltransferase [Phycisphaerales bacterium]